MDRSNIIPFLARQALGWNSDSATMAFVADLEAGRGSAINLARWDAAKAGVRTALRFFGDERLADIKCDVRNVPSLGTEA